MRCLSKDEIVLFCYGEIEKNQSKEIENHLRECPRCLKIYEGTKEFLSLLKRERKELSSFEIESMVRTVRERIKESSSNTLRKRLSRIFGNIFPRFTLRLRLVSIVAALVVFLLFLPIFHKYNISAVENKWDILQTELELSLDDEDPFTFDVYYSFDSSDLDSSKSNYPFVNFSRIS